MEMAVNDWKTNETYRHSIISANDLPKGDDYEYIAAPIKAELNAKKNVSKKYEFGIGSRTFTVYAVYPYSNRINHKRVYGIMDDALRKMYVWLYIACEFASPECSPNVSIFWYAADHKKKLPHMDGEIIDREHVNTAFTMACPISSNFIYIYRWEEWFKVLIHESFHTFGIDFAKLDEGPANMGVYSIFPVKCDLRFSESYTECWAEIINVIFVCLKEYPCTEPFVRIDRLVASIQKRIKNEQLFSIYQMCKVLKHNKMKYRDLYSSVGCKKYREKTHVFSYYILKSIFLFFYVDFIEWCAANNANILGFTKTQDNILSLVEFIRKRHRDSGFLQIIDRFESAVGPKENTLRMSISE
jgi:hypothetical protein